jgi:hypothetical protein
MLTIDNSLGTGAEPFRVALSKARTGFAKAGLADGAHSSMLKLPKWQL